jgi:membrane-anchored glycerophosphoryl diester phosphodiesterase (GDPDase)
MRTSGHLHYHEDLPIEIFLIILTIIIIGSLALPIGGMVVLLFNALVALSPVLIVVGAIIGVIKAVHYFTKTRNTG